MERPASFPWLPWLKTHQFPAETLYIRQLENGLKRPGDPSRPAPSPLASLVGDAAFDGDLTHGNNGTIPPIAERGLNLLVGRRFGLIPCHNTQATKDRMRNNVSKPLDRACAGRVLSERNMRSHLIIMGGVFRKDSSKVLRVEPDQMISAIAPDRPQRNEVGRSRMPMARTRALNATTDEIFWAPCPTGMLR